MATTTYDPASGRPTSLSTTEGGVTRTITTGYDSLGRVTSYTDADGVTSTTSYDLLGRPTSVSDGKGTQTLTYDSVTAQLTQVQDSQAGTFGATYDADGKMVSQTYPNGLVANTIYDESGSPTDLAYTKQGCSSNCVWFEEHVASSIHGQWLSRDSSLSDQAYTYDKLGRLTKVQDTPTSQGCSTRAYAYDLDSHRTGRTSYAPGSGGACSETSVSQVQSSTYDALDRVTNAGFKYDNWGRTTAVPASHSGGDVLNTSYYVNDMVRSQTQGSVTKGWLLDPTQMRQRASIPTGNVQEVMHYSDGSDSPTWSAVVNGGSTVSWERSVTGIDGGLAAVVATDGTATTTKLQLANLAGDITATASTSTSATAPTDTFESDEFGNPRQAGGAKKYGWLGAKERRSVLPSGVVQMEVRSYVPDMGRFTSVDPVVGGSANDYDYSNADPVNQVDLNGREATRKGGRTCYNGDWQANRGRQGGGHVHHQFEWCWKYDSDGRKVISHVDHSATISHGRFWEPVGSLSYTTTRLQNGSAYRLTASQTFKWCPPTVGMVGVCSWITVVSDVCLYAGVSFPMSGPTSKMRRAGSRPNC
jgi:RHS repeat-associated protein